MFERNMPLALRPLQTCPQRAGGREMGRRREVCVCPRDAGPLRCEGLREFFGCGATGTGPPYSEE